MKKIFVLMSMLIFTSMISFASNDSEPFTIIDSGMKSNFGIIGGENGKFYQIIVKSDRSKKEIIDLTTQMLVSMGIVKTEDVAANLDVVDDSKTEYVVPFHFETGIGIHPSGSEPLDVFGKMRFEFHEGGVKLTIENFDEKFFVVHKTNVDRFTMTENMKQYNEYCNAARAAEKATSKFGRLTAKIDKIQEITNIQGSITGIFQDAKNKINAKINEAENECLQILTNYRQRVDEQNVLFQKMISDGDAQWYTLEEYIQAVKKCDYFVKYKSAAEFSLKKYNKALEQHQLYSLPEKRWSRDIRYIFDGIFITLADALGGTIEGVVEDGVQTWVREGDLVVPTNPKEKSKYLKKKKSFTDYESYDK